MSYNMTSLWAEAEEAVERNARQFVNFKAELDKAYDKLVSLKQSRGPSNQELADSYAPGETVPVQYVDEAEAALVAMKAVMDAVTAGQLDDIEKYA